MSIYCVYLTCYSGNKLPPFYIGYCKTENIAKGYNGSVLSKKYKSIWDSERKLFPENFKTKILFQFLTKDEAIEKEQKLQLLVRAHKNPMYTNMSIGNKKFYYPLFTEETRAKLKEAAKYKCKRSCSEITKKKLSLINIGKKHSFETKKLLSSISKGKILGPRSEKTKILLSIKSKEQNRTETSIETKKKMSLQKTGRPNNKRVSIEGVLYDSLKTASNILNISYETVRYRIHSEIHKEWILLN